MGPWRLRCHRHSASEPDGGDGTAPAQGGYHKKYSCCYNKSIASRYVQQYGTESCCFGRWIIFILWSYHFSDSNLQCSVCWEDFKLNESVRQLNCDHLYHDPCIVPWLELHGTCPVCRYKLFVNVVECRASEFAWYSRYPTQAIPRDRERRLQ